MIPHFTSRTGTDIDRERQAITLTRTLSADPGRVFDAWHRPEQRGQWLGESALIGPAGAFSRSAPPRELVWDAPGALVVVTLAPVAGSTVVTLAVHCDTIERLEELLGRGLPEETAQALARLERFLG